MYCPVRCCGIHVVVYISRAEDEVKAILLAKEQPYQLDSTRLENHLQPRDFCLAM